MNNKNRNRLIVATLALVGVAQSFATGEFDSSTAVAGFSTGVTTAIAIVSSLVTLGAGLAVYRKIAGYFSKAK